jgi:hypothetical protein
MADLASGCARCVLDAARSAARDTDVAARVRPYRFVAHHRLVRRRRAPPSRGDSTPHSLLLDVAQPTDRVGAGSWLAVHPSSRTVFLDRTDDAGCSV